MIVVMCQFLELTLLVIQEFKVKNSALASVKAVQQFLPSTLVLEAVGKEDVGVVQRGVIVLGEFLETDNVCICGCIGLPAQGGYKWAADPSNRHDTSAQSFFYKAFIATKLTFRIPHRQKYAG